MMTPRATGISTVVSVLVCMGSPVWGRSGGLVQGGEGPRKTQKLKSGLVLRTKLRNSSQASFSAAKTQKLKSGVVSPPPPFSATANRMPVVGAPASEADAKLATNNSDDQGVFRVMDHLPASDDWRLNSTPASGRGHSPLFRMGFRMSFAFGPVLTIPLSDTTIKSRNSNFGNPTFVGSDAS